MQFATIGFICNDSLSPKLCSLVLVFCREALVTVLMDMLLNTSCEGAEPLSPTIIPLVKSQRSFYFPITVAEHILFRWTTRYTTSFEYIED